MSNRHLLRSITMQILYQIDVLDQFQAENVWDMINKTLKTLAPTISDTSYVKEVLEGIIANRQKIDSSIETYSREWRIITMAPVDRNILRIAVFEMMFYNEEDIPKKVSINEAIELGKSFSGPISGKFINGVLGGLYKEEFNSSKDQL